MAEPFKNLINANTLAQAAHHLHRVWPAFDATRFLAVAGRDLDALAFKARAMQIADALAATLPADFDRACGVLEDSLAPPLPLDARGEPVGLGLADPAAGLSGWVLWGAGEHVARCGLHDPDRALRCLHALTQRFTAEFALRPFLAQQPQRVWPVLRRWCDDDSAHVRRLVSEGSRPRLPWGLRLQALVRDPSPSWPLLEALRDDPSAYVRRSVANHLNDVAKDHPDAVAAWVRAARADAGPAREALLRHACRGLIKAGHPATLAAWGLSPGLQGEAALRVTPPRLRVGEDLTLEVDLRSNGPQAQALVVDYVLHHVGARGQTRPKVFKGWKLQLAPGEHTTRRTLHPMREHSTRRLHPGTHRVELQVNGVTLAEAGFELAR